ncbi:MAG: glycosyltransferase family 2 protein [Vicinamibacteria bacterium]
MSVKNLDCYLSVIAPLENDADIVEAFVSELTETLQESFANHEIVLVDDGSTDETASRVEGLLSSYERLRFIRLSRRFGQEIAISAGLDSVIGDFVVVMLPDGDPPRLVPSMVEKARAGAELVFGIRWSRRSDPLFLRFGASAFYWYCNRILGLDLPKNSTHFRVMSRRVVNALIQIKDRGRYLRTLSQHVGYRSQGYPYELEERRSPPRRKSVFQALDLAANIIATNSLRPLRLVSWLAILLSAANAFYLLYSAARGAPGASLQTGLGFVFVFLILAVLCEYLGRLVEESKGRPLYYVMEEKQGARPLLEDGRRNVVTESEEP